MRVSQPFPAIGLEHWRSKLAGKLPEPAWGLEGIAIAPLFDRPPAVAPPVPARAPGWAVVQRIEPEVALAEQTAELQPGDVDALWLDARQDGEAHDPELVV